MQHDPPPGPEWRRSWPMATRTEVILEFVRKIPQREWIAAFGRMVEQLKKEKENNEDTNVR